MPNTDVRWRIKMIGMEAMCGYGSGVMVLAKAGSQKFTLVSEDDDKWRIDRHWRARGFHFEEEKLRMDCHDDALALARFIDFLRQNRVTYSAIILFCP